MRSNDTQWNVQLSTRYRRMDKEDIARSPHYIFTEIETMITTEDYQNYWQRVDERTLPSFGGVTFSHYKVAAYHPMLSAMRVPHSMRKERHSPEVVGSWTDGSSRKDNRK